MDLIDIILGGNCNANAGSGGGLPVVELTTPIDPNDGSTTVLTPEDNARLNAVAGNHTFLLSLFLDYGEMQVKLSGAVVNLMDLRYALNMVDETQILSVNIIADGAGAWFAKMFSKLYNTSVSE